MTHDPSSKPVHPWFELFGHKLSATEITELKRSAAECGLSVNQWMDRAIRSAIRREFPVTPSPPAGHPS